MFTLCYEEKTYPDYKYTQKEVKTPYGTYMADFVQPHSCVEAIIYRWYNANAGDDWANVVEYHLTFLVKYKKNKKWTSINQKEFIRRGLSRNSDGLNSILFSLETSAFRNKYNKRTKIKELKETIKKSQKELEILTKKGK